MAEQTVDPAGTVTPAAVPTAAEGASGRPAAPLRGEITSLAAFFWGFTCIAAVLAGNRRDGLSAPRRSRA